MAGRIEAVPATDPPPVRMAGLSPPLYKDESTAERRPGGPVQVSSGAVGFEADTQPRGGFWKMANAEGRDYWNTAPTAGVSPKIPPAGSPTGR